MKFPTMVYRCPGPHQCPGGTYAFLGVSNETALTTALKDGWMLTMPEAMGHVAIKTAPVVVPAKPSELEVLGDEVPPTREELEKQAHELGIKFTKKTTDKELNEKIDASLRA